MRERHLRLDIFETREEVLRFAFYKGPQFLFIFTYISHLESYHRKGEKKGGESPQRWDRQRGVERGVNDGGAGKTLLVCGGFKEDIPTTAIQCHSEDEPYRSNHNASSRWKNKHQQSLVVTAMASHVATMVSCSGHWSITQELNVDAGRSSWRRQGLPNTTPVLTGWAESLLTRPLHQCRAGHVPNLHSAMWVPSRGRPLAGAWHQLCDQSYSALHFSIPGRQDKPELKGHKCGKTSSASIFTNEDAEICAHARNIITNLSSRGNVSPEEECLKNKLAGSEIAFRAKLSIGQPVHLLCSESCLLYRLPIDVCSGVGVVNL